MTRPAKEKNPTSTCPVLSGNKRNDKVI